MKTAKELLDEIVAHVILPPRGVITLAEIETEVPNWEANFSSMPEQQTKRFTKIVAELMNTNPRVEWKGESKRSGALRRAIHRREN